MSPKFDAEKVAEIHQHLHSHLPSESALRVKALETLLVDKGLVNPQTIDAWIEAYTDQIGPKRGASVVAKAWTDSEYKKRLLQDAPAAIDELGFVGKATGHLKVVENTDQVHNLVVCTLCSCYPFGILGIQPGSSDDPGAAFRTDLVGISFDPGIDGLRIDQSLIDQQSFQCLDAQRRFGG